MRVLDETAHQQKKEELMIKCFECYSEHGLNSIGIKGLAKACGISSGSLYTYFSDLDDLIIQSTDFCMTKVEDDFLKRAPKSISEVTKFIDETPYWTAEFHGKKYRLMYQVYTHPKYVEHGKKFFEGVNRRYRQYAMDLEGVLNIPHDVLMPLIFMFIRACVHYALFEDEYYLKMQLTLLKWGIKKYLEGSEELSEA